MRTRTYGGVRVTVRTVRKIKNRKYFKEKGSPNPPPPQVEERHSGAMSIYMYFTVRYAPTYARDARAIALLYQCVRETR